MAKNNWLGISAIVLVFKMMVVGCIDDEPTNGSGHSFDTRAIETMRTGLNNVVGI